MGNYAYGRRNYDRLATPRYNHVEACTFKKLWEIESILDCIKAKISEKGFAPLSYYYGLTGGEIISGDGDIGWTDLSNVHIYNTRYGYNLVMPQAQCLKEVDPVDSAIDMLRDAIANDDMSFVEDACSVLEGSLK